MVEYNEEKYVVLSEIARRFNISPRTCSKNILPNLTACYLPGRKHALYRLSDVEQLSQVRTVEKQVQPLMLMKQEEIIEARRAAL